MNKYKQRIQNLRRVAPEYPRISHLDKAISKMTHDDILIDNSEIYPIEVYVEEKIDGANMGVSWRDTGPVLRNRNNILKKGYSEIKTPSKAQFKSAWNWVHDHRKDIQMISKELMSEITIYGDWMLYSHSIEYNKLPDWFIAYDMWVVEEHKFLSSDKMDEMLSQTSISHIKSQKVTLNSREDVVKLSEMPSDYRDGVREGIVIKTSNGIYREEMYKVVNKHFVQRQDFNERIVKNKLK